MCSGARCWRSSPRLGGFGSARPSDLGRLAQARWEVIGSDVSRCDGRVTAGVTSKLSRAGLHVLRDTREQTPWQFSPDVIVEVVTLATGDYSLGGFSDRVAIERKSLPDLVACVGPERERFLDCCRRLRDYETKAIVVEASVRDVTGHRYRSQMNPSSVIGTTIAIWADYGVPTVWAGDALNAANMVERLFLRIWSRKSQEPLAGCTSGPFRDRIEAPAGRRAES
jgi:DNA excision repair protein ERCC-4